MLRRMAYRIPAAAALVDVVNIRPAVGLVVSSRNVQLISAAHISVATSQQSGGESKAQSSRQTLSRSAGKAVGQSAVQVQPTTPREPSRAPVSATEASLRQLDSSDAAAADGALAGSGNARPKLISNNLRLRDFAHANRLAPLEAHFAAMPEHDIISYSTVIKAFLRPGQLHRAADYLERLMASDIKTPSVECVSAILALLAPHPAGLDGEQRLLELIRRSGFRAADDAQKRLNDTFRYIDGMPAKERFAELVHAIGAGPDEALLTMLIDMAAKASDVARAEYYFAQIAASGLQPNAFTHTSLMDCYKRAGRYEMCFEVEQRMRTQGMVLPAPALVTLMVAAGHVGRPDRIGPLLEECLLFKGSGPLFVPFSAAVSAAARCGDFDGMRRHVALMQQHNVWPTVSMARSLASALRRGLPARAALMRACPADLIGEEPMTAEQRAVFDRVVGRLGRSANGTSSE